MKKVGLLITLLQLPFLGFSQGFQNLDFEFIDDENPLPKEWFIAEEVGCDFKFDAIKYQGSKSLLLYPFNGEARCSAIVLNILEKSIFNKKQKIRIIARVKSSESNGDVSIITKQLRASGAEIIKPFAFTNEEDSVKRDWRTLTFEQDIDSYTEHLAFGIKVFSKDSLWIDAFDMFLDDLKLIEGTPPQIQGPTASQVSWINESCIPIDSVDVSDLHSILEAIKNNNVVALGEVTHGSSQIYQLKGVIIKFLFSKGDYTILAMAMDMAEAERLNKYVLTGEGDPRDVLMQINYWPWKTEEFLQLLTWMNSFNRSNERKIQIMGFDISISNLGLDSLLVFASKYDERLLKYVNSVKVLFNDHYNKEEIDKFIHEVDKLMRYFASRKEKLSRSCGGAVYARMEYKIGGLKQTAMYYFLRSENRTIDNRVQYMAENLLWLFANNPTSKIVLWAHNAHICKGDYGGGVGMGAILKEKYPFFSIGFTLGNGYFNGSDESGSKVSSHALKPPIADSYESFLVKSRNPICFVNLNGLVENEQNGWLFEPHKLRYIGAALLSRYQFTSTTLLANFDALIFIQNSTPSRLIFQP